MKKFLPYILPAIFLLFCLSCNDSKHDDPTITKRLTKATITKNQESSLSIIITYNQLGQIANIKINNDQIDNFIYDGNSIIVNSIMTNNNAELSTQKKVKYQLSGDKITKEEESLYNPYINNQEYVSNIYTYSYSRNNLGETVWSLARWPLEDGTYQTASSSSIGTYTWENQNITRYRYQPSSIMEFEFTTDLQPQNFPYKVFRSLQPVGLESISPLNLQMGSSNKHLIKRAYWYNVPDANNICAEYLYSYNQIADYITEMTIIEKIYPASGQSSAENTYSFKFEYNE